MFKKIFKVQQGASLLEYAIVLALIALTAISAVSYMGTKVACQFEYINDVGLRPHGHWSGWVDISASVYRFCN